MSVQVAKSSAGTTPTAGRRTPLSLSGSVGKASKAQSANDSDKESSIPDVSLTASSSSNIKTASKNEKSENSTTDMKKLNDKSDKKNANLENQMTENINSAKEKGSDDKKKDDKKKDKDSSKKDDKKQENGLNEGKDASKTNGHKDDDKKSGDKNEKAAGSKGNLKQKELREQKDKEKEKEQEVKEVKDDGKSSESKKPDDKKTTVKNEENEGKYKKKSEDAGEKNKKVEVEKESDSKKKSKKEPETPKKDEKKAREIGSVTPVKDISPKQPVCNQSMASLSMEKELKGFATDGEEMESLVFDSDPDIREEPAETSTPGKILKIKQSAPLSVQKISYERQEIYEKYESVSVKDDKPNVSNVVTASLERPQFTSSYRTISGRRSLRPMKEYSFQSNYRESYRKINTELDYTTSSLNATVGSEIPNESSFSLFGRGKKRERTPPPVSSSNDSNEAQIDVELSPKSPKRARLDFSGIIGIVASPMTLLRSKLSRTKIQCSTPNGKVTSTTKDDEEGVENVSVIATEEMISSDIADASEDINIKDVEPVEKDVNDDFREGADIDISENMADFKKPQVSAPLENVNKRRMCNVM